MAKSKARQPSSRLSSEVRTADILAAARTVLAQKGYENVVLADIAREAGIVEGTIYRYFENKRDLLVKVAEAWFGEQLAIDSVLPLIHGTQNKIRHLAARTLTIIKSEPVLCRFMLMELRPDPNYRGSAFFELNRRYTRETLQVFKDAVASGEFRNDIPPSLLRDMLHGCIEHRTWAFLRGEGDFSVDEIASNIATVVYRGMVAGPMAAPAAESGRLDTVVGRLEAIADRLDPAPRQNAGPARR